MSQIKILVEDSRGKGKNGKRYAYIRPDYYCGNNSRKASGFTTKELADDVARICTKWYSPELFVYEVDGITIVSNNDTNALTEYWRVCQREKIGFIFPVTQKSKP